MVSHDKNFSPDIKVLILCGHKAYLQKSFLRVIYDLYILSNLLGMWLVSSHT